MRIRDRLIKGSLLNFIAMAFNQGSTLLINILVARILLKQVFGEYSMVYTTLLTASTLAQVATGYTAAKYLAEFRSCDQEKTSRIMGLCSLISLLMAIIASSVLLLLAPWMSGSILNAPHLGLSIRIGAIFLFFSTINGYQTGALSGLEAFAKLAKAGILSGLTAIAAIYIGARTGNLNGALIGLGVGGFFRCLFHYYYLRTQTRQLGIFPDYRGGIANERSIILKFALPAAISGYFSMPIIWATNSLLARQPDGYSEMALYASSSTLRMLVIFLPTTISNVATSVLNNVRSSENQGNYARVFRASISVNFILSLVIAGAIWLYGAQVLAVFGKDFSQGEGVLRALLISAIFETMSMTLFQHMQAQGKIWLTFFTITVPRELVLLTAAWFLVPTYGALGLGLAYAAAFLVCMLATAAAVYKTRNNQRNSI